MDRFHQIMESVASLAMRLPPLLLGAVAAILAVSVGGAIGRRSPRIGGLVRRLGNLTLLGVFVLSAMRFIRLDPAFDTLGTDLGMPAQTVVGEETRVPLSADGHYWIEASVNGSRQRFMVDTGATITALSGDSAEAAGVETDPLRPPVVVRTANGPVEAQMARVEELRFGSVVARRMDAIVTGSTGGLNVLGMNFLSRLKGWRVEDSVLILTPRHPQAAEDQAGS